MSLLKGDVYELKSVKIGSSKLSSSLTKQIDIASIEIHSDWKGKKRCRICACVCNDIGLIRLKEELQFNKFIDKINLVSKGKILLQI